VVLSEISTGRSGSGVYFLRVLLFPVANRFASACFSYIIAPIDSKLGALTRQIGWPQSKISFNRFYFTALILGLRATCNFKVLLLI
jgi:hypothetical protein